MKKYLKLIVPNIITLFRVVLTIKFIILLNNELVLERKEQSIVYLAVIFLGICISDFIDGKMARFLNVTSKFGSVFDVISDLLYILYSTMVLIKFNMIPIWFIFVIILKFTDFVVTSKFINNYKNISKKAFVFDYVGRMVAVFFYIVPFAVIFLNKYLLGTSIYITTLIIYIVTLLACISLIQRTIMCVRIIKSDTV